MPREYYRALGVSPGCSQEEIRRAYRRLARRYHPDVCREEGAEERFKEISKAYAVLSDPEKRRRYDRYGDENGGLAGFGATTDFFDLFDQLFGGFNGHGVHREPARGADLHYEMAIDLHGVLQGVEAEVEVTRQAECETCGGSGAAPGSSPTTCPLCGGTGQVSQSRQVLFGAMITTGTCPQCGGRGSVITEPCPECGGHGVVNARQKVLVTIPPGISDGQAIRMAGHGHVPEGGGIPGDLIIHVHVEPHELFARRNQDLLMELDITFAQAALGDTITVPTLEGDVEVTIPPGTQHGDSIKLAGKGLPPLHGGRRGQQIVSLRVVTPRNLDEDQRRLLMEFALRRGERIQPPDGSSLFDRIRQVLSGEG